ncbi:MAG: hypothetical protein J6Y32_03890 [Bacteroidales bacterium]|nr:hypothetical protein [Bacteroidales bacterium]
MNKKENTLIISGFLWCWGDLALPVISNQKMNQYLADYKSMKPYIDIAEKAKTDAMDAMEKALSE